MYRFKLVATKAMGKNAEDDASMVEMTEAQRYIHELRNEYETVTPKIQPIGGSLNPKLTAHINLAAEWASEDKQALFALGTDINKTLWDNNKKVKDHLQTLQA